MILFFPSEGRWGKKGKEKASSTNLHDAWRQNKLLRTVPWGRPPYPYTMCVQIGHSQAQSQLPCTHLLAHPIQSTGLGRLYFQERSVLNVNGTLWRSEHSALENKAECSERQRHTLWLQAGGGRAVRSCTDRCVSLSSEHVHCHGNRGHSLCRSSEIYLVPMLWVTNPVEAEQGMENITSLPFHEFKGSTSFYLSSADSWAGF